MPAGHRDYACDVDCGAVTYMEFVCLCERDQKNFTECDFFIKMRAVPGERDV